VVVGGGRGGGGPPPPPPPGRGGPAGVLGLVRLAAFTCLAVGLGFLAYTGYRIWDPGARDAQRQMTARLHKLWSEQASHPQAPIILRTGQPFATIKIPAFGPSWQFAIVQGTTLKQLALGPGHVPGTALPGAPGNFAVAAHDITAGNPFLHLSTLRGGDAVIVQTADGTYRYAVTSEAVVHYTDTAVLAPDPGHPGIAPTTQSITLITCTPVTLAFTPWRVVVTGTLVKTTLTALHQPRR
jgi:sortase A